MSSITLLGVSNENYQFGTQFIVINLSYGIATPIAAYVFLPVFYKMQNASAYEVIKIIILC
jgi:sodium-coupled monocarboxylate transporter 8/12